MTTLKIPRKTRGKFTASLGGAWAQGEHAERAREAYPGIGYVFVELPGGEHLQLFFNLETRLFVADVVKGRRGNEFVRMEVPRP